MLTYIPKSMPIAGKQPSCPGHCPGGFSIDSRDEWLTPREAAAKSQNVLRVCENEAIGPLGNVRSLHYISHEMPGEDNIYSNC